MDKETLSNYGWIVIAVLILSVMIALATPFGTYIEQGVWSVTEGLFDTEQKALEAAGIGVLPEITYEGQSGGYWKSDERWVTNTSVSSKRTNKIPVSSGDMFYYTGQSTSSSVSVIWYNESNEIVGFEQEDYLNGRGIFTVPDGVTSATFYSLRWSSNPDDVVLDVSWLSCKAQNYNSVKNNPLSLKKIVFDGDSICAGTKETGGKGYAWPIWETSGCSLVNQAKGAGTLTPSRNGKHSVVDNLDNLPKDGDIYCFEGGYNDAINSVSIGTFDPDDMTGAVDKTTLCGALETIFRYVQNNTDGEICFVISHAVGRWYPDYVDAMIGVCNKYSVSYYNAYDNNGLGSDKSHDDLYFTKLDDGTVDGVHPNADGYKQFYIPQVTDMLNSII